MDGQDRRARRSRAGPLPLHVHARRRRGRPNGRPRAHRDRRRPRIGPRYGIAFFSTELRLNQIQALGTHNSYHVAPTTRSPPSRQWQYSHDPLDVQFQSEGIRQIELDVWANPNGLQVFHVPYVDAGVTCSLLEACLQTVKTWSDAHPKHMPIAILLEIEDVPYTPEILPFDAAAFDQLDAEIRSVFPPASVLTPDDVRGQHATLAEAVTTDGWPTIDSVRGQVMFLMDNAGAYRDTYTAGHPTLEGRMIFTNSEVGRPDAAFIKLNNPIGDATRDPRRGRRGLRRAHPGRRRHRTRPAANNTGAPRRRARRRRAVGEHGLRGAGPRVRPAVLRLDPRRHAGALQPAQRAARGAPRAMIESLTP